VIAKFREFGQADRKRHDRERSNHVVEAIWAAPCFSRIGIDSDSVEKFKSTFHIRPRQRIFCSASSQRLPGTPLIVCRRRHPPSCAGSGHALRRATISQRGCVPGSTEAPTRLRNSAALFRSVSMWCCRSGLNTRPPPYQGGAASFTAAYTIRPNANFPLLRLAKPNYSRGGGQGLFYTDLLSSAYKVLTRRGEGVHGANFKASRGCGAA
jgi:hypothetical protein